MKTITPLKRFDYISDCFFDDQKKLSLKDLNRTGIAIIILSTSCSACYSVLDSVVSRVDFTNLIVLIECELEDYVELKSVISEELLFLRQKRQFLIDHFSVPGVPWILLIDRENKVQWSAPFNQTAMEKMDDFLSGITE